MERETITLDARAQHRLYVLLACTGRDFARFPGLRFRDPLA